MKKENTQIIGLLSIIAVLASLVAYNVSQIQEKLKTSVPETQAAACANLPQGANLVGWWDAEGDANDRVAVNANHGTLTGSASVTTGGNGYVGEAFDFSSGYVNVPTDPVFDLSTSVTISAWARWDNVTDWDRIAGRYKGSCSDPWRSYSLELNNNNHGNVDTRGINWVLGSTSQVDWGVSSANPVGEGAWYHVVGTYDSNAGSNNVRLYINGVLDNSATSTAVINDDDFPNQPFRIGNSPSTCNEWMDGKVDEVMLWNTALTDAEVKQLYDASTNGVCTGCADGLSSASIVECDDDNTAQGDGCNSICKLECATEPSGLVAWWRAEDNALDFKSSNEGTIANGTAYSSGKVGNAFSFDGSDDSLNASSAVELDAIATKTVVAWIYPETNGEGNGGKIMTKINSGETVGWSLNITTGTTSPRLQFSQAFDGVDGVWLSPDDSLLLNAWNHVAITYDQSSTANDPVMYINGSSVTVSETGTPTGTVFTDAAHDLMIGTSIDGDKTFDGLLDELQIYNTILGASDVFSIFTSDSQGMCTATCGVKESGAPAACLGASNVAPGFTVVTDDSSTVGSPTEAGNPVTFTATASDSNSDNYYLLVCADGDTAIPNASAAPSCSSSQICVSSSTATGVQATCNSANVSATPTSVNWESFVCDHSTDSKCSATETTNSPYNVTANTAPELTAMSEDDGIMTNGAIFASGLSGQAMSFDGTDDYIDLDAHVTSLNFSGAATFAFWMKSGNDACQVIYHINDSGGDANNMKVLIGDCLLGLTDDLISVARDGSGGGPYRFGYANVTGQTRLDEMFNDEWHHVAIVWDSATPRIYIDGVSKTVTTAQQGPSSIEDYGGVASAAVSNIGVQYTGSFAAYYNGDLDDVQLYNTALTGAQVEAIYEARSGGLCEVTTGCTGLPDDATHWYQFEETTASTAVVNNVGTTDGVIQGDTADNLTSTGKVENAFDLDGSADHVNVSLDLATYDEITIASWINISAKPTSPSDELISSIVTQYPGNNPGFIFDTYDGGVGGNHNDGLRLYTGNASTGSACQLGDGTLTFDTWTHVAATYVRSTGATKIFVNGSEQASCTTQANFTNGGLTTVSIGNQDNGGTENHHLDGKMDEFMIFDRALSEAEINAIYTADSNGICTNLCSIDNSLLAWYSGDVDATDRKHFNDGTFNGGMGITSSSGGKINEAFSFDGTDDYASLSTGALLDGSSETTVSAWVYPDAGYTSAYRAVYYAANNGGVGQVVLQSLITTGYMRFVIGDTLCDSATALTADTWNYVTGTYDGSNIRIYQNGVLQNTCAKTGTITDAATAKNIGRYEGGSQYFDGKIDELQIYNRALSAQEIENMYTAQNAGTFTGTCYESCLEEPANLVSHWQGDFDAKDSKGSNDGDTFGANEPGDTLHFRGSVSDVDLVAGRDTFVSMAICSDGSTFGTAAAPCSGGTLICDAQHQKPGSVVCDAPSTQIDIPEPHGNTDYEVFVWDQDDEQATYTSPSADSYAVTDVAPVINSFTLGGAIDLTAGGQMSPAYSWSAVVTDNNGDADIDQASESGKFYDEGASQTSACDANTGTNTNAQTECYEDTDCSYGSTVDGDEQVTVTCEFPLWFNANASSSWEGYLTIADDGANTVTGDSDTVSSLLQTVNGLQAIDAVDNADATGVEIRYGLLAPGQKNTILSQEVNVANKGNQVFDTFITGSVLCDNWDTAYTTCNAGGNTIAIGQQEWSETFGVPHGSGSDLTGSQSASSCINNNVPIRAINTETSTNDPIYFGIELPSTVPTGDYTGQNTFTATSSTGSCNL